MIKSSKTADGKIDAAQRERDANKSHLAGLQGLFNSYPVNSSQQPQPRPSHPQQQQQQQPRPNIQLPVNPNMMSMQNPNPLARLLELQQEAVIQSQKRSSPPVAAINTFMPTSVMRKMTGDPQTKVNPSGPMPTSYGAVPPINNGSGFPSNYNSSNHVNSSLASFMSAMSAQPQHQPQHAHAPPQMPPVPGGNQHIHQHHMPTHVPPAHQGGFHPPLPHQRMHYPVMVGPPNSNMRAQFPPFMMYGPQMPPRK